MEKKTVLDLFAERKDGKRSEVCTTNSCSSDDSSSCSDAKTIEQQKVEASKDPLSLMDPNDALEIRRAGKVSDINLSALSNMWSGSDEVVEDMSGHQFESKKSKKRREN